MSTSLGLDVTETSVRGNRTARRLALDVLYEAEIRDSLPLDAFALRAEQGWVVPSGSGDGEVDRVPPEGDSLEYAKALISGVQEHHADIDSLIGRYADRWSIDRMPIVDLTILRIALFELLWGPNVPVPVLINEAVEMAKSLSTEDSGRFINGLLGRVAEEREKN